MVRQSILQMARHKAFTQDMVGGFTLAEGCCGQFALYGADRRGWRCGSIRVVVLCRLCTGMYWLYGLPRFLSRLSRGGGHSRAGLRGELRLDLDLCLRLHARL